MSEWLKEHAWKACVGETLPRVRIPLSPPSASARAKSQAGYGEMAPVPRMRSRHSGDLSGVAQTEAAKAHESLSLRQPSLARLASELRLGRLVSSQSHAKAVTP